MTKRMVIKGLNYTEMQYIKESMEPDTIIHWKLSKQRKPEDCGIWIDGKKVKNFEDMVKP